MMIILVAAVAAFAIGCGQGADQAKQISGEWKLVDFSSEKSDFKLTECDSQTSWDFTNEAAEDVNGKEAYKLNVTAPAECKFYDFEAKWTVMDEGLFISSSRIGGMGGVSNAGLFKIEKLDNKQMTLNVMGNTYQLQKK